MMEMQELIFAVQPNPKNIIDETNPHKRLVSKGINGIFPVAQKNISKRGAISTPHSCAMDLQESLIHEGEIIAFQKVRKNGKNGSVWSFGIRVLKKSTTHCLDAFINGNIGIERLNIHSEKEGSVGQADVRQTCYKME